MSTQQTSDAEKTRNEVPRAEKIKVPLKLSAVHAPAEMPLHDDSKQLPGAVVVAITCGVNHAELVFHHPYGETRLEKDKWVCTPIHEVQTLLANGVDPSKDKKDAKVQELRLAFALEVGHYVKVGATNELHLPPSILKGAGVGDIRQAAKAAWENAKREAHTKYLSECTAAKTKPKKDWKFGHSVDAYLPVEFREYEKTFNQKFKVDRKEEIAKLIGKPFETLAGPNSDRSQRAVSAGRDYTPEQLVDGIKRTLMLSTSGDGQFDVHYREAYATFLAAGDDAGKLKEFIFQFAFPGMRPISAPPADTSAPPT